MKYDLSIPNETKDFESKVIHLKALNKIVELKECRKLRGIKQNAYLHVCITLYAIYFGYTLAEAKTMLKRECSFMVYEKKETKFLKETKKMDSKELTSFIDWIRNYAAQNGCDIPTADEYLQNQHKIDNEIRRNQEYL